MRFVLGWRSLAVAGVLIAAAVSSGCSTLPASQDRAAENTDPSRSYLANEVEPGWSRSVDRTESLVLVFEAATAVSPGERLPYRFVLFNTSDRSVSWNDTFFVVRDRRSDGKGGFGLHGARPIGMVGSAVPPSPLTLRSGESTTVAREISGPAISRRSSIVLLEGSLVVVDSADSRDKRLMRTSEVEVQLW